MKLVSKIQSKLNSVAKDDNAVTLTMETVFMIILVVIAISGVWHIVMTYIVGDGGEDEVTSFSEAIKNTIGGLF